MKKSLLISISGITLIALTATTLYAQTVAGTSLVDKMKAAARNSFALSADLNPGQTGFDSAPLSGKKTGNMLTAGEWNRVLELISEGGSGGSAGSNSSPLFYYCTNAQSLDSTNVPCYGASRNQGLGDGRYRVVSCHIKATTGHESINSQLLNFGRTGLANMQDKWNSLYTDSQWQLCIEGSVLVVDTQASGGGASSSASTGIGTPDYQSDWIDFGLAGNPVKKKFTHNLGTENYMIQMEGKGPGGDGNNCPTFIGADSSNSWLMNSGYWYYYDKNSTSVSVANYTNSLGRCSRYIRIKLWKHGAPVIAPASTVTNL